MTLLLAGVVREHQIGGAIRDAVNFGFVLMDGMSELEPPELVLASSFYLLQVRKRFVEISICSNFNIPS